MSAPPLHVFLSPASIPEVGLEHVCLRRTAGMQASTGMPAGAGAAGLGLGGGQPSACRDPHGQRPCQGHHSGCQFPQSQRRLWWGWGSGPGSTLPEEAVSGWCVGSWDLHSPQQLCGGWYSGPPGPMWLEEAPAGAGFRPGTHAAGGDLGGGAPARKGLVGLGLRPGIHVAGSGLSGAGSGGGGCSGPGLHQAHQGPSGQGRCWLHPLRSPSPPKIPLHPR